MTLLVAIPLLALGLCTNALRINNASELIALSNSVNNGTSYSGTTVFLDADVDFSGNLSDLFVPIGKNGTNYFRGTFDGQGYIISGLAINSSSQYTGLFGYTNGATIRNVVLDSSCSISSAYTASSSRYSYAYIGGLVGYFYSSGATSAVENSINKASVSFSGNVSRSELRIGGIIGDTYQYNNEAYVKNCANYGDILNLGTSRFTYIGGIVGYCQINAKTRFQNCFNHGSITNNGTTSSSTYIGGIAGYATTGKIENCVNFGRVKSINSYLYIGAISGYSGSGVVYNCYWSIGSCANACDSSCQSELTNSASFNSSFELTKTVATGKYNGSSLIEALNAGTEFLVAYTKSDYSNWLINKDNKTVNFKINNRAKSLTLNTQIILLPSLSKEGNLWFERWYTDEGLTSPLADFEVIADTNLYGTWEENRRNYSISFDTRRDAEIEPIIAQFNSEVMLPDGSSARAGCSVAFWENEYGEAVGWTVTVQAHNITLHAVWSCTHITSTEDFVDFSISANYGTDYSQEAIFLEADIDFSGGFSERYEPIASKPILCFDGQGHTISNLVLNNSLWTVGLFGYISGATIRNVVLDSTCSFTSESYCGGVVALCESSYCPCVIENNVNMAQLISYGSAYETYIGGIAGGIIWKSYMTVVKNNVNYGSVSLQDDGTNNFVGGIVGYSEGGPDSRIYNTLNYGDISYTGNASRSITFIGGIAGLNTRSEIDNSVNLGKIISTTGSESIGGIVGSLWYSSVSHCFWNKDYNLSANSIELTTTFSGCATIDTNTFELKSWTSGQPIKRQWKSIADELNTVASAHTIQNYSPWILNKDRKTISFTVNGKTSKFSLNSQVILLPSFGSSGNLIFDGWYTDSSCTKPLSAFDISTDSTLHGKWGESRNNYTITFNTQGGGSVAPITAGLGDTVVLPYYEVEKEGHMLLRWDTEGGETAPWDFAMPGRNLALYAVWLPTYIKSAEQLIELANAVNSGINPDKVSVLLGSDINFGPELSNEFEGIGKEWVNPFLGTFDGQGHVIKNLVINSTAKSVGMIGFTERSSIKGVVLDSSCTVTGTRSTDSVDELISSIIGGLVGVCDASRIEGVVNMASVSYLGESAGHESYVGGIAGIFYNTGNPTQGKFNEYIYNSVNYGTVTHAGSSKLAYVGGITGDFNGYVENSANYGIVKHNGNSKEAYVGGISGYGRGYATWCLSVGTIACKKGTNTSVGSFFGSGEMLDISNCTWTHDVETDNATEGGLTRVFFENINEVEGLNVTIAEEMNEAAREAGVWSKWVMLYLNGGKVNGLSQDVLIVTQKALPVPQKEGYKFTFWCKDEICNEVYNPLTTNITEVAELYAQYVITYTVTFDYNNGTTTKYVIGYNETITYPADPVRAGYAFVGWNSSVERMPNHNITIIALWAEDPSEYVEVVIGKKGLTDAEIEEALKGFTDDKFTIERIETDKETGDTMVIIKFTDTEKAAAFVRNVNKNARENPSSFVRRATMMPKENNSFSVRVISAPQLLALLPLALAL